jgi:uncharacterized protein
MKITFGNHELLLHPSGVLFWPDQSLLIVSDLHLEKGSHFAQRGFFLPPYDSHETLGKLHKAIDEVSPRKILLLGDCFHDAKGYGRLRTKERALFDALLRYHPVWITGNHDGDFVPEGFTAHDAYTLDTITFRHEATADGQFEISGHFHPKTDILHKGATITRPCFIEDGRKMILPAFGAYTGGLSVSHPSIATLLLKEPRLYILGQNKIYAAKDQPPQNH